MRRQSHFCTAKIQRRPLYMHICHILVNRDSQPTSQPANQPANHRHNQLLFQPETFRTSQLHSRAYSPQNNHLAVHRPNPAKNPQISPVCNLPDNRPSRLRLALQHREGASQPINHPICQQYFQQANQAISPRHNPHCIQRPNHQRHPRQRQPTARHAASLNRPLDRHPSPPQSHTRHLCPLRCPQCPLPCPTRPVGPPVFPRNSNRTFSSLRSPSY